MAIAQRIKAVRGGFSKVPEYQTQNRLTATSIPEEAPSISILDRTNRYALVNLVPENFREIIEAVPKEYFSMSEVELREVVKPDDTLSRLKIRFWDEWQVSLLAGVYARIRISSVYFGICTEEYFYENVIRKLKNVAWVVTPPSDYIVTMREVLNRGLSRLGDIISLPLETREPLVSRGELIRDDEGNILYKTTINANVIREVRQLVALLSDRVHGAVVQRLDIEQKSLSMDLSAGAMDILQEVSQSSLVSTPAQNVLEARVVDKLSGTTDSELARLTSQLESLERVLEVYPVEVEEVKEVALDG